MTHMTMAEFFIIRPHGPNCWMGLGAFSDRVRLSIKTNENDAINSHDHNSSHLNQIIHIKSKINQKFIEIITNNNHLK